MGRTFSDLDGVWGCGGGRCLLVLQLQQAIQWLIQWWTLSGGVLRCRHLDVYLMTDGV